MKKTFRLLLGTTLMAAVIPFGSAQAQPSEINHGQEKLVHLPNPYRGQGPFIGDLGGAKNAGHGGGSRSNGINYWGGPVMVNGVNIYYIWYGNWSGNTATTILTDFANDIGGSPYFNINTTYYDGSNRHVQNSVTSVKYAGFTTDSYSQGTSLSDAQIQAGTLTRRSAVPISNTPSSAILTVA
jgi:hypothetical protein